MSMRTTTTRGSEGEDSLFNEKKIKETWEGRSMWNEDLNEIVEVRKCPQHACTLQDLLGRKVDRLEDIIVDLDSEKS